MCPCAQDKLEQEEFQAVLTGEEKEQISGKLSEASGWLDEDGYSADTKVSTVGGLTQSS